MSQTNHSDGLEWEEWDPNEVSFVGHLVAGSLAGLSEHITMFPLDTLKTHIQCERCGATSIFQTWSCASGIVKREGILRLWRGVGAMFAGCIPAHAAYFSIFEVAKVSLGADRQGHHPLQAAASGASAVFGHDIFMNPFDVVKQRMQLGYYRSSIHCIESIIKVEGITGFYASFPTTLMTNIPYGGIMVATNESMRRILDPSGNYGISTLLVSGTIAGAVASFLTTPLDVVKTKLQTQNVLPCPRNSPQIHEINRQFTGAFDASKHIMKTEGLRGFFKGCVARMLTQAPGVAVSWTVYEQMKKLFGARK